MPKISYYLAISLDGYLAREDGSVGWLDNYMEPLNTPYDYEPYYSTVGSVIMGRKTYEKVLSFGEYPYRGKPGLVLTTRPDYKVEPGLKVVSENWKAEVQELAQANEGRTWLVGGGEVANLFVREGLLDEIVLTIIPETLGRGLGWLGGEALSASWSLQESFQSKSGITQLVYGRK